MWSGRSISVGCSNSGNGTWGRIAIPQWQAVEAENLTRMSANLSFLDVTGGDGKARFVIRFHGATIAEVYGAVDCRGQFLDEIIPAANHRPDSPHITAR